MLLPVHYQMEKFMNKIVSTLGIMATVAYSATTYADETRESRVTYDSVCVRSKLHQREVRKTCGCRSNVWPPTGGYVQQLYGQIGRAHV